MLLLFFKKIWEELQMIELIRQSQKNGELEGG
jgi:hypothetical protein